LHRIATYSFISGTVSPTEKQQPESAANSLKCSSSCDMSKQATNSLTSPQTFDSQGSHSSNKSTCAKNLPTIAKNSLTTVSENIEPPGSPFKSRKSALKSRVPVKYNLSSMPILNFHDDEEEVKKKIEAFTQSSNEDLMNHFVAQPLVTILAETHDVDLAVDHFLSNSEIFQSFNQVLEEFSANESTLNMASSLENPGKLFTQLFLFQN
jgi:hypothetical protein